MAPSFADFFKPAEAATPLGNLRTLSPLAGIRVSPLALGAMSIGDAWPWMGTLSKEDAFKLLDAFVEAGGNYIDTANNYQDDKSEQWIGEWMEARGNRDQIVLATKYTMNYKGYAQGKVTTGNSAGNHKKSLHISIRDSLKKLRTDYIDILYVHWWEFTTSIEEVMDTLDAYVKTGKVLYLGISDTPAWVVSAANMYAKAHAKTPFVVYQGRYNVMLRDMEREIFPMAIANGMALNLWDVLGSGKLLNKKQVEERKANQESLRMGFEGTEQSAREVKYSQVLNGIAESRGFDSPTVIALAYAMNKAPNVIPLVGGRKVAHLHSNIQAIGVKLTDEEIKKIEDVETFAIGFPSDFVGTLTGHGVQPSAFVTPQLGPMTYRFEAGTSVPYQG